MKENQINYLGVIKSKDGSCRILHPTQSGLLEVSLEEMCQKSLRPGETYKIIDSSGTPKNREFRLAWELNVDSGAIEIDLEKAKGVRLKKIREVRDRELKTLDLALMRADEDEDTSLRLEIIAKKKMLRDLPENINFSSVKTLDELRSTWPKELGGEN